MTLLDASITLVDAARQLPENAKLERAIKRMEKRIRLLRLRKVKARRRCRKAAWNLALSIFWNNSDKRVQFIVCSGCFDKVSFGTFCRHAQIDGRGVCKHLECPNCGKLLIGVPDEE